MNERSTFIRVLIVCALLAAAALVWSLAGCTPATVIVYECPQAAPAEIIAAIDSLHAACIAR